MMRLNITVPVFNEEKMLPGSIAQLHAFAAKRLRFSWKIVIADNASTDRTLETALSLAAEFPGVCVLHVDQKGRGGSLSDRG